MIFNLWIESVGHGMLRGCEHKCFSRGTKEREDVHIYTKCTVNMLIMHMLVMHKPSIASTWGCSHCGACQKCRIIAYCILHDPTPLNMHYNGSTNRGGCVHCGLVEVDIMIL